MTSTQERPAFYSFKNFSTQQHQQQQQQQQQQHHKTMVDKREESVFMAKLAESAERYDDMVDAMKAVAKLDVELTVEERNLLSVSYKNVIGARRASWRIVSSIEQKEESKGNTPNVEKIQEFRKTVETELNILCSDILSLLDDHLISSASSPYSKVFFHKMKGDYYRYLAEFSTDEALAKASENSAAAYEEAFTLASSGLDSTNPIRLGLGLNYSVFQYEILHNPDEAIKLAKQAFEDAIAQVDRLEDEEYKDSTLIMQLLRDNLTLWTSELVESGAGEEEEE